MASRVGEVERLFFKTLKTTLATPDPNPERGVLSNHVHYIDVPVVVLPLHKRDNVYLYMLVHIHMCTSFTSSLVPWNLTRPLTRRRAV